MYPDTPTELTLEHAKAILSVEHGFPTWRAFVDASPRDALRGQMRKRARHYEYVLWSWLTNTVKELRSPPGPGRQDAYSLSVYMQTTGVAEADALKRQSRMAEVHELCETAGVVADLVMQFGQLLYIERERGRGDAAWALEELAESVQLAGRLHAE